MGGLTRISLPVKDCSPHDFTKDGVMPITVKRPKNSVIEEQARRNQRQVDELISQINFDTLEIPAFLRRYPVQMAAQTEVEVAVAAPE